VKIVLDTNVFLSGIFFTGPPYLILRAWHHGNLELVYSPEILDEYRRVGLELSIKYLSIDIEPFLALAVHTGLMVKPGQLAEQICQDADDDKFIACALAAGCDIIVSGDKHLLKVSGFRSLRILKPAEFVKGYIHK
jgi:uncharacterized protein